MKPPGLRVLLVLAGLATVLGLPVAGKWVRSCGEPRCALDGRRIEPLYRARVVQAGRSWDFCCAGCAVRWLGRSGREPEAVFLTDEAGGGEVEARSAYLVASAVVTNPITGDRTHAFARREDAEEHARAFGGEVRSGSEWPWRGTAGPGD